MFDFAKIRQTITSLAGELSKLRSERERLMRGREDLEAAPICKSDLLELIDAWIDPGPRTFPSGFAARRSST